MIKKILLIALCLCIVFSLGIAGCKKKTEETAKTTETETATEQESIADKTPYKIGAVISLTGDYSGLGVPEKNTIDMEVKKINDSGGVNGYPIEVIIEDDGTDTTKAVAATSKLIGTEKVIAIIGATGTGQTMAMRADIEKAQIPQVSMAGGNAVTEPVNKWVFATPWPNRVIVDKTIGYLNDQGIKEVALLTDNGGFGKDGKAVLETKLPEAGIKIVTAEEFTPTDLDMKAQLTKIKGTTAKAIIVWNAGKAASIIAKEMQELQITIPMIGSHGIARREFIDGAGDAANGVVFAAGKIIVPDAYGDSESGKIAKQFITDYTKAYKEAPNGTFPGHAYDALYIIVDALEKLGDAPEDLDPVALRDQIEKTTGLNLIGGQFNYTETDHAGLVADDTVLIKVEGGKFTWMK